MKKLNLSALVVAFTLVSICKTENSNSQGAAINTSGTSADASSILDVSSANKGFLIPRLTTIQRDAIVSPAEALQIYNLTTKCFGYYEYGVWQTLNCAVCPTPAQPSAISGSTTPCQGSSQTYAVTNVSGMTYTWTFPSGWNQTA